MFLAVRWVDKSLVKLGCFLFFFPKSAAREAEHWVVDISKIYPELPTTAQKKGLRAQESMCTATAGSWRADWAAGVSLTQICTTTKFTVPLNTHHQAFVGRGVTLVGCSASVTAPHPVLEFHECKRQGSDGPSNSFIIADIVPVDLF